MQISLKKAEEYMVRTGISALLARCDRVVVAFSGGADSAFLLCLLRKMLDGTNISLEAAHLNHMIRGEEADRDEGFCRRRAERLGIRLHVRRVDIPALSKKTGQSTEAAARQARYAFFEDVCASGEGRTLVATAHNADDNLETVLFNLLRGSAARGMCGIPPVRDSVYIRPLLPFTGDEIRRLCRENLIEYVFDSTNAETEYTRNRIRHLVVPELEKISPSPQASALRMTEALREDADYLDSVAEGIELENGRISLPELSSLPKPILSRVLVRMYEYRKKGSTDDHIHLESIHINDIISLLKSGNKSFTVHVPGKAEFYCRGSICGFFDRETAEAVSEIDVSPSELILDGEATEKNGYEIRFLSEKGLSSMKDLPEGVNIYNLSIHKSFRFDRIYGKLTVRCRMEGDSYRYGGMTRRVKKVMSEKRIPLCERDTLPVFCDDSGILFIPGLPVRDDASDEDGEQVHIVVRKLS